MPGSASYSQARSNGIISVAIFAVALILRLLFLFSRPDATWPHSALYEGDSPEWVRWAQALYSGQPYEFDLPLRSPGVAYALYWLGAGDPGVQSFVIWKVLWCVMSAATCSLSYLGFVTVFSRRVSLIAAGLCVFSFGNLVIATSLNNEAPYALFLFAAILVTLHLARQPSMWLAVILALLHGAAMLLRAEHPPFMLAMTGWLVWQWKSRDRQVEIPAPKSNRRGRGSQRSSREAPAMRLTWRNAIAIIAIIVGGSVVLCLPWSISGARAIQRFNTVPAAPIDYANLRPPDAPENFPVVTWSAGAQAAMSALPAFVRTHSSRVLTSLVGMSGRTEVIPEDVKRLYSEYFHSTPEPLKSWALLSIKGPMDFAIANHPDAAGGYSNSALVLPGVTPTIMNLSHTDHLYLLNHGYKAGWEYIRSDVGKWVGNLGHKMANFIDGFTLGYSALNLPRGPYGQRRAVDLTTMYPRSIVWESVILGLFVTGVVMALRKGVGGLWLLVIAGKVLIALAFYGYARQAVSIFPAFALFMALPIELGVEWFRAKPWIGQRAGLVFGGPIVAALVIVDLITFISPRAAAVDGPIKVAPQWGPTAFECSGPIVIKPASSP